MTLIRLPNFDRKDYLFKRRMAIIQKAHLPLQIRLQRIMNQAIDEKVLSLYDDVDEDIQTGYTAPAYKEEILLAEIGRQNLLATNQDMTRLLDRSIVNQNHITNMEKYNASKKISDRITKVEVERINKNLEYVEKTLQEAELDIARYKNLVDKLPKQVSRQDILEKALAKGSNYKGREYSYKELNRLSRDLEKYKSNAMRYEKGIIENQQANREGLPVPNVMKTWIWSTLERTRHREMDGETVRFTEKFTVTNEVTGDVDYLRFPRDIENDHNNCSNVCNCQCEWDSD